jgi:flagellar hook-basal body complex protein FliE
MTLYKPELVSGDRISMAVTNPRHLVPKTGAYAASGEALATLGGKVGADAVLKTGSFEDVMLKALDGVNADQNNSSALMQQMVTDPDSVDSHDVTIVGKPTFPHTQGGAGSDSPGLVGSDKHALTRFLGRLLVREQNEWITNSYQVRPLAKWTMVQKLMMFASSFPRSRGRVLFTFRPRPTWCR